VLRQTSLLINRSRYTITKGYFKTLEKFFNELEEKKFSKIRFDEIALVSEDLDKILAYFRSYSSTTLADKFIEDSSRGLYCTDS
jgi:hypothetical protein